MGRPVWAAVGLLLGFLVLVAPSAGHGSAPPAPAAPARDTQSTINRLKIDFLAKFPLFVEWPGSAFREPDTPIVIGLFGDDPFGTELISTLPGLPAVDGRSLVVRRFRELGEVDGCHILFVGRLQRGALRDLLNRLRRAPVLTVGDFEGFAHKGGMINFVRIKSRDERVRIRFEVNLEAARRAGLRVSAKMLQASTVVSTEL